MDILQLTNGQIFYSPSMQRAEMGGYNLDGDKALYVSIQQDDKGMTQIGCAKISETTFRAKTLYIPESAIAMACVLGDDEIRKQFDAALSGLIIAKDMPRGPHR